jgi:HSP20 family molecular chaperone IbpA
MELTPQNQPQDLNIRDAIADMFPQSLWDSFDDNQPQARNLTEPRFVFPAAPEPPTVDVSETDDELQITANVIGYDPKSLWVNVDHGVLTIKGTMHQGNAMSTFTQQLAIPEETTKEDVECEMANGKLLITIQKN